jgi:hypothetical protein
MSETPFVPVDEHRKIRFQKIIVPAHQVEAMDFQSGRR